MGANEKLTFYAVAAQIYPVLLLAFLFEVRDRKAIQRTPTLVFLLALITGEMFALINIYKPSSEWGWEPMANLVIIVGGFFYITYLTVMHRPAER